MRIASIILCFLIINVCAAQQYISGKYIPLDSAWAWNMAGTLTADTVHRYQFANPIKGIDSIWYVPAVDYIYFPFPSPTTVVSLPDSFFIRAISVQTFTIGK